MAKIRPYKRTIKAKTGDVLDVNADITVDSDGIFYLSIPRELADIFQGSDEFSAAREGGGLGYGVVGSLGTPRVNAKSLDVLTKVVDRLMELWAGVEVKHDLMIHVSFSCSVSYVTDLAGKIHPNGAHVPDFKWHGGRSATSPQEPYGVSIGAQVIIRSTHTRGSAVKVDRIMATGNTLRDAFQDGDPEDLGMDYAEKYLGPWAQKLNGFVGCKPLSMRAHNGVNTFVTEMPYTEEAARFFFDALTAVCGLAHRLSPIFSDPLALEVRANSGASALLAPPKAD